MIPRPPTIACLVGTRGRLSLLIWTPPRTHLHRTLLGPCRPCQFHQPPPERARRRSGAAHAKPPSEPLGAPGAAPNDVRQGRSFGPGGLLATPLFLPETRLVAPPDITRDLLSGLPTYAEAMSDHPPTYATVVAVRSTEQPSGALVPDDQRRTQNSGAWRPPRVNSRELYRAQRAARGSSDHAPYRRQGCCGVVGRHAVFGVVAIVVVIILVFLWR